MAHFALTMVNGRAYDPSRGRREQAAWDEHAEFMDSLVDDGVVILGGPVGDGSRVLLIVEADDEETIRRRLGDDPWEEMGILTIGRIEPWTIWLDGTARGNQPR
jgi:uncharacterized protein YciI